MTIRTYLLSAVESVTLNKFIESFQRFCGISNGKPKNLFLHFYFKLASALGEEIFYLMPFMFWFSFENAIVFVTNFGLVLVFGQISKDVLKLPRPASKEEMYTIFKLEQHFQTEYGFPSTHTMSGFLPYAVLLSLERDGTQITSFSKILCVLYILSIALSRLYLGVHSLVDIAGGLFLGTILTCILAIFGDYFDDFVYKSVQGLIFSLVSLAFFLTMYPKATPWRASYGTAAIIYGTWLGCATAMWTAFNFAPILVSTTSELSQ